MCPLRPGEEVQRPPQRLGSSACARPVSGRGFRCAPRFRLGYGLLPPPKGRRETSQSAPGLRDVTASRRRSPGLQPWVSCPLAAAWSVAGETVTVQGGLEGVVHRIRARIAQVWRENRVMSQRQWVGRCLFSFLETLLSAKTYSSR